MRIIKNEIQEEHRKIKSDFRYEYQNGRRETELDIQGLASDF